MKMATDNLLQEFPPVSTQAWEEAIHKDLKGADYAKKLIWQTEEGLAVKPYYRAEDIAGLDYLDAAPGDFPFVRGARLSGDWRIREEIDAADPEEANRAACARGGCGRRRDRVSRRRSCRMLPIWECFWPTCRRFLFILKMPAKLLLLSADGASRASAPISTGLDPLADLDFAAEVTRSAPPALVPFTIDGAEV